MVASIRVVDAATDVIFGTANTFLPFEADYRRVPAPRARDKETRQ
jgi:hypothetical protein